MGILNKNSRFLSLFLALALCAASPRAWAVTAKTGPTGTPSGSGANAVLALVQSALQTAINPAMPLPAPQLSAAPDELPALPLPVALLSHDANANLAYLLKQAESAKQTVPGATAPAALSRAYSLQVLGIANKVLGRFPAEDFKKLPASEQRAVLDEIWTGARQLPASASDARALPDGGLKAAVQRAAAINKTQPVNDLLLQGERSDMPQVAEGRLVYWEPGTIEVYPFLAEPGDSAALALAKVENEIAALREIWMRSARREQLPSPERVWADQVVEQAASLIRTQKLKMSVALPQVLSQKPPSPETARARTILLNFESKERLVYLPENWKGHLTRQGFLRILIRREKDLLRSRLGDRLLRFPYRFRPGAPPGERTTTQMMQDNVRHEGEKLFADIEQGLTAKQAIRLLFKKLDPIFLSLESAIKKHDLHHDFDFKTSKDSALVNLIKRTNFFAETKAVFKEIEKNLDTNSSIHGLKDSPSLRQEGLSREEALHQAAWTQTKDRFRGAPKKLQDFLAEMDAHIRARLKEGRPAHLAAADFFVQRYDDISAMGSTPEREAMMFYAFSLRHGSLENPKQADQDLIVLARSIPDLSDFAAILMHFHGQGRVRAIITPLPVKGADQVATARHWIGDAKAEGIVVIPNADLGRTRISLDTLIQTIRKGDLWAMADGKRGQALINPDRAAREQWQERGRSYAQINDLHLSHARLPASFEGEPVAVLAEEANPEAFQDQAGGSRLARSGAHGVGLSRMEELMKEFGVERDPERLSLGLADSLAGPFFKNNEPMIVRLYDFAPDKQPQFLKESRSATQLQELLKTHNGARFYLDANEPELRQFGKIQLQAIFEAHLKGLPRRNLRILFSDVRTPEEVDAIEAFMAEARSEFIIEKSLKDDAVSELEQIPIGYMFEGVPAVERSDAITQKIADQRPRHPVFIGIGTSDLTQSLTSPEFSKIPWRNAEELRALKTLHPLLIRSLWQIGTSAARHGIDVTVEGERASSPRLNLALLALRALENLDFTPVPHTQAIPAILDLIRTADARILGASPRRDIKENMLAVVRDILRGVLPRPSVLPRLAEATAQKIEDIIVTARGPPRKSAAELDQEKAHLEDQLKQSSVQTKRLKFIGDGLAHDVRNRLMTLLIVLDQKEEIHPVMPAERSLQSQAKTLTEDLNRFMEEASNKQTTDEPDNQMPRPPPSVRELQAAQLEARKLILRVHDIEQKIGAFTDSIPADIKHPTAAPSGDEQEQRLQAMFVGNIHEVSLILENYKSFQRMDEGDQGFHPRAMDMGSLIRDIAKNQRFLAEFKKISLNVFIPTDLPLAWADPAAMFAVLTNLMGNALKYTREGGQIILRVERDPESPDHIIISAQDTGIGIPPEAIPEILKGRRYRTQQGRHLAPGHGIGTEVILELLNASGSSLQIKSAAGKGSVFSFKIPIAR